MIRLVGALAAFAFVALMGAQAQAQDARGGSLLGHWECGVSNAQELPFQRVTFDYSPDSTTAIRFFAAANNGAVTMTMTINAAWTYDSANGAYSQSVSSARIDDIVVNGQPMARSQFPSGEAGLQAIEQNFVDQYGNAQLNLTSLTERNMVLVDGGGVAMNCAR